MISPESIYPLPVSVITPAYNAARFMPRCLATVTRQGVECEHIVIDDCSTDNTAEVLDRLKQTNPQLVFLRSPRNAGPMEARNLAIHNARGRFLAFLDADDVWLPAKLSKQIAFMEPRAAAISFTDYRFMTQDAHLVGARIRGPSQIGWHLHHMTRYLGCLTVMVDRVFCPDFHFPTVQREIKAEDFLAWAKIIREHGSAYRYPEDLARYSVVKGSRSSDGVGAACTVWDLYRNIECIPFPQAAAYFITYAAFTMAKRFICKPRHVMPLAEQSLFSLDSYDQ
jgi:glycosyltransferase involved in cell wall biosynthesis